MWEDNLGIHEVLFAQYLTLNVIPSCISNVTAEIIEQALYVFD